jgi:hypothetical protein
LAAQVADKQSELEKMKEEKEAAERERDDALYSAKGLQNDLERVQKQHELKQKEITDQLALLEESSKISDQKSKDLQK